MRLCGRSSLGGRASCPPRAGSPRSGRSSLGGKAFFPGREGILPSEGWKPSFPGVLPWEGGHLALRGLEALVPGRSSLGGKASCPPRAGVPRRSSLGGRASALRGLEALVPRRCSLGAKRAQSHRGPNVLHERFADRPRPGRATLQLGFHIAGVCQQPLVFGTPRRQKGV